MIHGILPVSPRAWQSFSTISVQVFFGLPLGLTPSTSYSILHTYSRRRILINHMLNLPQSTTTNDLAWLWGHCSCLKPYWITHYDHSAYISAYREIEYQISSNEIKLICSNISHQHRLEQISPWAGPTRLETALTVTLKQYVKQVPTRMTVHWLNTSIVSHSNCTGVFTVYSCFYLVLCYVNSPSPLIDNIWAVMFVWR